MDKSVEKQENMKFLIYSAVAVLSAMTVASFTTDTSENRHVLSCPLVNVSTQDAKFHCELASTEKKEKLRDNLKMDQALINLIANKSKSDLILYANWDVCHMCPCINFTVIHVGENVSCVVDTSFPITVEIVDHHKNGTICRLHKQLDQYGVYNMWIEETVHGNSSCNFEPSPSSPNDSNTPIYVALGILAFFAVIAWFMNLMHRRGYLYRVAVCMPHERLINTDLGLPDSPQELVNSQETLILPPKPAAPKVRLQSLDTFRGLSLVIMIFVNYAGGGYWFFHHSAWNGLTVADLVFPWFTFIMGTSIALAFKKMVSRGASKKQLIFKVVKRTAILFILGLMISNTGNRGFVDVQYLRIPGVLQRLALTYFVVAITEVFFAGRSFSTDQEQSRLWCLRDILPFWPEWLISLSFLTLHLCLTFLLPVPGCPTGYLGPGGLHEYPSHVNCTGGAAGYIDNYIFGKNHIYGHPTCKVPYQTTTSYDPEGILGTLTSIFMCFLGLQAGKIIVLYPRHVQRIKRWMIWGVLCGAIAGILCQFSQNDGWIPVNKNFWSVSFVLALSSMAFFLLIFCYITIDVWKVWSGAPFLYPGMNSIVVYMCHEVFHLYFPIQFSVSNTHAAQLAMNMYGTALWTLMAAYMYYKEIFIAI